MDSRKSRIKAFLDTLPSSDITDGVQSTLLKTAMNHVGGSTTNSGDCTNINREACHKSKNAGSCKNSVNYCNDSKNGSNCGPVLLPQRKGREMENASDHGHFALFYACI